MRTPKDIDEYIALFPRDVQAILQKIRRTIRSAAPEAEEAIGYQMPSFRLDGVLIYFAAWKRHIGIYPPIAGDPRLEQALAPYAGPKGNLLFPLDQPIPYDLIRQIVKLRVKQNRARAASMRRGSRRQARRKTVLAGQKAGAMRRGSRRPARRKVSKSR